MIEQTHTLEALRALPTLETDNRKVHAEPWLLKVWSGRHRIWITESGQASREVWHNSQYERDYGYAPDQPTTNI